MKNETAVNKNEKKAKSILLPNRGPLHLFSMIS
jgi:hypothetical protein